MYRDTHTARCDWRIWRPQTAIVAAIATVTSVVNIGTAWATPSAVDAVAAVGGKQRPPSHHIGGGGVLDLTGAPLVVWGIVLLIAGVAALLWFGRRRPDADPLAAPLE